MRLKPAGRVDAIRERSALMLVSKGALAADSDAMPASRPPGRMRVVLNVHGGQQGLARCLDGLVDRNVRAIREGRGPADYTTAGLRADRGAHAWKDVPTAVADGYTSAQTEAAWYAAGLRAKGQKVALGFRGGRPAVYGPGGRLLREWPDAKPLKGLGETEGRCDERMLLQIDDGAALPVREVNQAIARHNAVRIKQKGLPPLYSGRVKYKPEGTPELWWDAEEILSHGFDDCEGLAAYRAGELMDKGYDARVWTRLVQMPSKEMGGSGKGGRLFHAVTKVNLPDGGVAWDDSSMRLGMGVPAWYKEWAAQARAEGRDL